ncbi:MAG: NADH-quinone oxidoreductase subunit I [Candidatus Hydrogenedentota bacterium]
MQGKDYVKNVELKEDLIDTIALPAIIKGLLVTLKHSFKKPYTINYPKESGYKGERYRGIHRLKKDEYGRPKCVACFICATVCPSKCISIVAEESGWSDREKVCKEFVIDELRCIFCGFCQEVCPCDALELTSKTGIADYKRENFVFDKDKLLSI